MLERHVIPDKFIQPVVLGLQVRHLLQTRTKMWQSVQSGCQHDLSLACGVASYWLWRGLRQLGRHDMSLAYGFVSKAGHCWLQDVNGNIVDVTATQFFPSAKKVEVMSEYASSVRHYCMVDCGYKVISDFKYWDAYTRPERYRKIFLPWIQSLRADCT